MFHLISSGALLAQLAGRESHNLKVLISSPQGTLKLSKLMKNLWVKKWFTYTFHYWPLIIPIFRSTFLIVIPYLLKSLPFPPVLILIILPLRSWHNPNHSVIFHCSCWVPAIQVFNYQCDKVLGWSLCFYPLPKIIPSLKAWSSDSETFLLLQACQTSPPPTFYNSWKWEHIV